MSEQLEVWLDRLERLIDGEDHSSVREHLVAIKSSMLQRRDLHLDVFQRNPHLFKRCDVLRRVWQDLAREGQGMAANHSLHLDHVKTWVNRVRRQHAENNVLLQDSLNLVCGGEA